MGRDAEARAKGQIILEGAGLERLAAHLETRLETLLDQFEPNPHMRDLFRGKETLRNIHHRGRSFEVSERDAGSWDILVVAGHLEAVQQASKDQSRVCLFFRHGMTRRADHLLRILARDDSMASIQQMVAACQNLLDEAEIRASIQQLEKLGHVSCSGDEVRLTKTGRAIL